MNSRTDLDSDRAVTARRFVEAFRTVAESVRKELISIWRDSTTDASYTTFMFSRVFPATAKGLALKMSPEYSYVDDAGRSRRLDAAFLLPTEATRMQEVVVAIEMENKEATLGEEIEKLSSLQLPLRVLYFYSSAKARDRRLREIEGHVGGLEQARDSEYLVMWNKPYQEDPHWVPFLVTPSATEELPGFKISDLGSEDPGSAAWS